MKPEDLTDNVGILVDELIAFSKEHCLDPVVVCTKFLDLYQKQEQEKGIPSLEYNHKQYSQIMLDRVRDCYEKTVEMIKGKK